MALGQLGFATLLLCVTPQLPGAHFIDVIFILLSAVKNVDLWLTLFSVKYPSKHGSEICSLRCQALISCRSRESVSAKLNKLVKKKLMNHQSCFSHY